MRRPLIFQKNFPVMTSDINEFSLADSFVLVVLRGFRLLQSAGLNAEEKRDVLASTKGSLEFQEPYALTALRTESSAQVIEAVAKG